MLSLCVLSVITSLGANEDPVLRFKEVVDGFDSVRLVYCPTLPKVVSCSPPGVIS